MTESAATESWDDVPTRDCYTKVQGQRCGPEHGWASWLGTFYRCTGTRTPGVAVAALDGDERGVAAPTSPPLPVDTAAPCPQGRTDYEACFAPFRYCPVKGCGRMEQALEPTPEIIQALVDAAPPISEYALRVKHAVEQIGHALTDSRIDGAAAAWLRTIRSGLTGGDDE